MITLEQAQILKVLAQGGTVDTAAHEIGRTRETIRYQLLLARRKLNAKNATHAVANAVRQGLI